MLLELNDSRVDRSCASVREKLIALHNHQDEMSKAQIVQLFEEVILNLMDIVEMLDK
jgi:hypothetical protein